MAEVKNLDKLIAKFNAMPSAVREAAHDADDKNSAEFFELVTRTVPKGYEVSGQNSRLVETLRRIPGRLGAGFAVMIGDDESPYPAHLEYGHMDHGVHVPAKPFWWPAVRILKKKFNARRARMVRLALKKFFLAGGSTIG